MCIQWYYLPTHPVTNNVRLALWMHHSTILSVYVGNVPDNLKIGVIIITKHQQVLHYIIEKDKYEELFQSCYSKVDALLLPL